MRPGRGRWRAPADAAALEEVIGSRLAGGYRATFTIRQGGRAVGITSVLFDPHEPAGAEVGGTLLDPCVWGKGVNTEVKRLLLAVIFGHGAQWVQLPTDERNGRSAAAIRKLGGTDLGIRQEPLLRRDGTRRQSRIFRIDRPGPSMPARDLTRRRGSRLPNSAMQHASADPLSDRSPGTCQCSAGPPPAPEAGAVSAVAQSGSMAVHALERPPPQLDPDPR